MQMNLRPTTLIIAFAFVSCLTNAETIAPQTPKTMKAVVVHAYGGAEALHYEDTPVPQPKEDEVLVCVVASGVNRPIR